MDNIDKTIVVGCSTALTSSAMGLVLNVRERSCVPLSEKVLHYGTAAGVFIIVGGFLTRAFT